MPLKTELVRILRRGKVPIKREKLSEEKEEFFKEILEEVVWIFDGISKLEEDFDSKIEEIKNKEDVELEDYEAAIKTGLSKSGALRRYVSELEKLSQAYQEGKISQVHKRTEKKKSSESELIT